MAGAFARWGRPQWLRVDNGPPWGAPHGGLPTALNLWSAGLDVRTHGNDPYQPQQNGVVERTQQTTEKWVDPEQCRHLADLRERVAQEDYIQREVYPAIAGQSRRQAYPGLLHSSRGYTRGWEEVCWDLEKALVWLGEHRVRRKVNRQGKVSVYDWGLAVGPEHAGQWLEVQFGVQTGEWVLSQAEETLLRRCAAPQLTRENIRALRVARSRRQQHEG
jgi:hypothetical protein